MIQTRFRWNEVCLVNKLVSLDAKCQSFVDARRLFDQMPRRNVVSWTVIIAAYARSGFAEEALALFYEMQRTGIPNQFTFVTVLPACAHLTALEGQYFDLMSRYYRITPAMEHYGFMVNLLDRAGYLDEAHDFINKMPINPDDSVWGCLLGACRIHNNIELGECVA
eukprot:Gb_24921 [translate_table: standard]